MSALAGGEAGHGELGVGNCPGTGRDAEPAQGMISEVGGCRWLSRRYQPVRGDKTTILAAACGTMGGTMARLFTKRDEDFLLFLRMGAAGTQRTLVWLKEHGDHQPELLDRGAVVPKIWTQRVKRLRVPDVFCLKCGARIEVRSKKNPRFTMSHSETQPGREWDSGLREQDYAAFVVVQETNGGLTADDLVQFLQVGEMREAHRRGQTRRPPRKAPTDAAEGQLEWPAVFAQAPGTVVDIRESQRGQQLAVRYDGSRNNSSVLLKRSDREAQRSWSLVPQVQPGNRFERFQALASVVPVRQGFDCTQSATVKIFVDMAKQPHPALQHTGVRALGLLGAKDGLRQEEAEEIVDVLRTVLSSEAEPIVKVEAALSLSSINDAEGLRWLATTALDSGATVVLRFECIQALADVRNADAVSTLVRLLKCEPDRGLRAASAWALGRLAPTSSTEKVLEALIATFSEQSQQVRAEAAHALAQLLDDRLEFLLDRLEDATPDEQAGIAWAVGHGGTQEMVNQILDWVTGGGHRREVRAWAAYMLAVKDVLQNATSLPSLGEMEKSDPQLYFAVVVLAQLLRSWVYRLGDSLEP